MYNEVVKLENPERFANAPEISREKLTKALDKACKKLEENIDKFYNKFPGTCTVNFKYEQKDLFNWESGMLTGCYWLAYKHTGNTKFRDAAANHVKIYAEYAAKNENLGSHDVGFIFSPSCIADYKMNGNEDAKKAALDAAEILLTHYDWTNMFVLRSGCKPEPENAWKYRTLVDTMMNIPLFFWAYEETGKEEFLEAAVGHYRTTIKYLIREDGTSFHHYQFDVETLKPLYGCTLQGNSDDSCWGRGHSWLVYGFPIAYSYTKNADIPDAHKTVSNVLLNRLPSDCIPYWDFDFTEGSDEPRDASIACIAACGFMEMVKYMDEADEYKAIYNNAAYQMMDAVIDKCENTGDADGLILHVTHALPQNQGIDECAVYGDYFYMEALTRMLDPDFKKFW